MPYFRYMDKNVYYEVIGSGVPLLLLHGNMKSSREVKLWRIPAEK